MTTDEVHKSVYKCIDTSIKILEVLLESKLHREVYQDVNLLFLVSSVVHITQKTDLIEKVKTSLLSKVATNVKINQLFSMGLEIIRFDFYKIALWLDSTFYQNNVHLKKINERVLETDTNSYHKLSYKELTDTLLQEYIQSFSPSSTKTSSYWFQVGVNIIVHKKWKDLMDMNIVNKDNVVKKTDEVYFVTHVIFMGTDYGTKPLDKTLTKLKRKKLISLVQKWLQDINKHDENNYSTILPKIKKNCEIYCELCTSLLQLSPHKIISKLPNYVQKFRDTLIHSLLHGQFYTDFKASVNEHEYNSNYHSICVSLMFLVECLKKEKPFDILKYKGVILFQQKISPCFPNLLKSIYNLNENIIDLVLNVFPNEDMSIQTPQTSIITLELKKKTLEKIAKKSIENLKFSSKMWNKLKFGLSNLLQIPQERLLIIPQMTYFRAKKNNSSTRIHSDFYYFIKETDLFQQVSAFNPKKDKTVCLMCNQKKKVSILGKKKVQICKDCVNSYIPIYTCWISLGTYTKGQNSLLEFVDNSANFDYSVTNKQQMKNEFPFNSETNARNQDWKYPSASLKPCDMLIFNCKTIHRALGAKTKKSIQNARYSIDFRFIILPVNKQKSQDELNNVAFTLLEFFENMNLVDYELVVEYLKTNGHDVYNNLQATEKEYVHSYLLDTLPPDNNFENITITTKTSTKKKLKKSNKKKVVPKKKKARRSVTLNKKFDCINL